VSDARRWYVRLDHLCEQLGLDPSGQRRRVQTNEAIADYYVVMSIETEYQDSTRLREVGFLDLEALPFWLGMIETAKIKPEIRPRLLLYQWISSGLCMRPIALKCSHRT
jgi:P22_AR N-terminal domain